MGTYADVIATLLAEAGISYLFGMPGSRASVELIEAARKQDIRYVLSNNEAAAAVMAATYGVLERRPGVCSTGVGPGATNAVNGVAHAYLERAPMLLLTDRYPDPLYRYLPRQRVDQERLFRPVTKGSFPIAPDSVERSVRRALQLAMEGRPGPVHLDLPDDVLRSPAPALPPPCPVQRWHGAASAESAAVRRLAAVLNEAARPLVLVGLGVNRGGCEAPLQRFVERLQAPVLCTISAKGTLPDDHPLCGGTFLGSEAPHPLLAASDLLIAVGFDVVELFEPAPWPYSQPLVNIDVVPHADGILRPAYELIGDIGTSLEALTPLLAPCRGWEGRLARAAGAAERGSCASQPAPATGKRLLPADAIRVMRDVLPRDAILTTDAGQHKVFASRLWQSYAPLTYLTSSGLGSMGVALPIAIVAKLLRPERAVVALTGDGGFLMRVGELETARRENAALVVVVFNDGCLNLIKMKQERQGYAVRGSQFAPVDFAKVAAGFGCRAARVADAATLHDVLQQAVADHEPWVIDALIDPEGY
ncbi:MAG: acetolactate synthase [Candidatus Tectimicrobiota bacterium]|nr:MAG: acetolactate synthase [Candidatus Tectomicrobia bacterium]